MGIFYDPKHQDRLLSIIKDWIRKEPDNLIVHPPRRPVIYSLIIVTEVGELLSDRMHDWFYMCLSTV